MTTSYASGNKELIDKNGNILPTVSQEEAVQNGYNLLRSKSGTQNEQLLLVAHNGHSFDQNRLIRFLNTGSSLGIDEKKIYLDDSLPTLIKVIE